MQRCANRPDTSCYPLAVTGSIAAGKSRLCRQLVERGRLQGVDVTAVAVDQLRVQLLEGSGTAARRVQRQLLQHFGAGILGPARAISRCALGDLIFGDAAALAVHDRLLDRELTAVLRERRRRAAGIFLVEWALVAEKNKLELTDYNVLLVSCTEQRQLERLSGGDLPLEQCRRRIALQLSAPEKERELRRAQSAAGRGDFYHWSTEPGSRASDFDVLLSEIICGYRRLQRD